MTPELSRTLPDEGGDLPSDPDADGLTATLRATEEVAAALQRVRAHDARTLEEQVLLTEIPAPPFAEEERARAMAELMRQADLDDVTTDEEGNVLGWFGPAGPRPLVLSAHLDTVFPKGTDVRVRQEGGRYVGPGISDDGRGLAALLAVARALKAGRVALGGPILFAATVGEEGVGDLRGVRHLFGPRGRARDAAGFVSLDGAGNRRLIHQAVGSWRARATVTGPGGHSWVDWGAPNPLQALARGVAALASIPLDPGTTVSVGRMAGGTSINAIPSEAWAELEVRSVGPGALERVSAALRTAVAEGVARTNADRSEGTAPLTLDWSLMGTRPAGATAPDDPLVRAAAAATRSTGYTPRLSAASTDANLPMSLGIPAITLGAGGRADGAHTVAEWYENRGGPEGVARALLTVVVFDALTRG